MELLLRLHAVALGVQVCIVWSPGHLGIEGNKLADELAKMGEEGEGGEGQAADKDGRAYGSNIQGIAESFTSVLSDGSHGKESEVGGSGTWADRLKLEFAKVVLLSSPPAKADGRLPESISALKQAHRELLQQEWARLWSAFCTGSRLRDISPHPPGSTFSEPSHTLPRRSATLLACLRAGFHLLR
ncbi:hypothetical protein JCM8547_005333 [Rhodosporidiobolus lusitaniae]